MAIDEVRTYAEAAQWLPSDVRRMIEVTRPCASGDAHTWEHSAIDVTSFGGGPAQIHNWRCYGCGTFSDVDPASVSV